MAVVQPRILDVNLFNASANVLTADSAEQALPLRYLGDQLRSKPWRSRGPWVVVAGWNDKIDFDRGGVKVATVAAGTYATGAALGVAIVAALEIADATPVWAVTYPYIGGVWAISSDIDFELLTGTGANLATGIWAEIGFDTGSDSGVGLLFFGATATVQGRHWIACDFGAATAITAAILLEDNVSASGTVKVLSSATSVLDALTAPDQSQTLVDRGDHWSLYFNSQSHRYVVFLFDDTTNTDGFNEAGIAFLGTYRSPGGYSANFEEPGQDLSIITNATEGAPHGDQRPEARSWLLEWRNQQAATVASLWRDFRADTPQGKAFFFDLDSAVPNIVYVYREGPLPVTTTDGGTSYKVTATLREALA